MRVSADAERSDLLVTNRFLVRQVLYTGSRPPMLRGSPQDDGFLGSPWSASEEAIASMQSKRLERLPEREATARASRCNARASARRPWARATSPRTCVVSASTTSAGLARKASS